MVDANMIKDHVPCLFRYAAVWSSLSSLQGRWVSVFAAETRREQQTHSLIGWFEETAVYRLDSHPLTSLPPLHSIKS